MSGDVWLISSDLMFPSRVMSAAQQQGCAATLVRDATHLQDLLAAGVPAQVFFDLNTPSVPLPEAMQQLQTQASSPRVVAYASHVHEPLLEAAREAGCDLVLSRGQFSTQIDDLLRG